MSTYIIISSDSHIIEPADLWEQRIDRKFRDRAPRLVHEADADQWMGIENLSWASDYPHAEPTFPRSREIVDRILQGVPEAEQVQIAGAHTAQLYHFSTDKLPLHTEAGVSL